MLELPIIGKAVFFVEGDESGEPCQATIVEFEGAPHLVANWYLETATGKRIPDELVPMEKLPHMHLGDNLYQLGTLVPMELLSSPIPPELRLAYGVVSNPVLAHIPILAPNQ